MKKCVNFNRIVLILITAAISVVLFAMSVFAEENNFFIEAEFTLPNGFKYSTEAFTKEKTSVDQNGDQPYSVMEYTVVLPYNVKNTPVILRFSEGSEIMIDGKSVAYGTSMVLKEGICTMVCNGTSGYLNVMYTSDVPQIYIDTEQSRKYIETDRDHIGNGTIVITDGIDTYYSGELETIKGRGNVSWNKVKKPYKIKLAQKASLFDMEPSKKYNLIANYDDKSIIRNKLAISYAEKTGIDYCIQSQFVDLYFEHEYRGCYEITERIEVGEGRVGIFDIDIITEQSNPGVDLDNLLQGGEYGTEAVEKKGSYKWLDVPNDIAKQIQGGYLIETELASRYRSASAGFVTNYGQAITISNPQFASKAQVEYIRDYYQKFEDAVLSGDGYNSLGVYYTEYIDIESMAKMYVLQEFVQNLDAGLASTFLYKDINGKLAMCSPWDFDHSLGDTRISLGRDVSDPENIWVAEGALFKQEDAYTIFSLLWQHADFRAEAVNQWNNVFRNETEWLKNMASDVAAEINASAVAEYYRWHTKGDSSVQQAEELRTSAVDRVIDYIEKRTAFMDEFLAEGNVTVTYSANGAEGFTADKMPYTPGSTVTLKESRYKNEDDTGKIEFIGWNTKADGSGTAYQPGDEITVDKNIILYAQWDKDAGDYIYRKPPAQNRTLLEIMVEFLDKII